MWWFLIFAAFVIFAPLLLFLTGLAVGLLAIPFIIFFGIWIVIIWGVSLLLPAFFWLGVGLGLLVALGAARASYVAVEHKRQRRDFR
jgi:hypothetical protein